ADAAVLTCFFRTLQLGFVGQYRAEDDNGVRTWRKRLADAAVLTCFFRTLQLGFVGQYRAEDDNGVRTWR
ncbi:hypothetical protein C0U44_32440, partial [Klebsiella pneumoniae]